MAPARDTSERTWHLTEHVCRVCRGRILSSAGDGAAFRCAECGLEVEGKVQSLCACGTKLKSGRSAGLRCQRNADHQQGLSPEFVAVYEGDR